MDFTFLLIPLAAVIAPLLAAAVKKVLVVPLIVFEIALGIALGPSGLNWVTDGNVVDTFSQLGLAMLFFMAGNEINVDSVRGPSGGRALKGWIISAVLALAAGFLFGDSPQAGVIIAIAFTGTALGTITPILRDSGLTSGKLGAGLSGIGAVGEFLPLVAITIFLSGKNPLAGVITLVVFLAVAALAFYTSSRKERPWLQRMVTTTLHTSGQFAIRLVILILAGLVALALVLGVDFLLGAFTAGLLARFILRGSSSEEQEIVDTKLEAIAFGFFVPIFFITTGVTFPLKDLLSEPSSLALVPVFAIVFLAVRGIPSFFLSGPGLNFSDRRTAALFASTTLPLVIAVTNIGVDNKVLDSTMAAALTGGAMVTVLLFPMLALVGRKDDVDNAEKISIDEH